MIKVHRMLHTSSLLKPGDEMSFSSWEWVSSSVYINKKKNRLMSHENNTIQNRKIKAVWSRPLVVIFRFKTRLL